MEKLYYTDRYLKEFTAEVESVVQKDNKFHVVLDKTAFFPGGGGQPGDTGLIDNIKVIDVYEENGIVYHVLEKKPLRIHRVKCSIEWEKRFDGMQQHLGQHVLSGCFYSLFNANTVSFHMGNESSTVDIEGYLEEEKIREAERMANVIIQSNIEVELLMPTKSELKKLKLRRDLPKTNEAITVLKIGDLDINACCGVHPKTTLDLGLIKIKKWEKHKGSTRIEFLAGKRAVNDYFKKDQFSASICKFLNCGEQDAINTIKNLSNHIKELNEENKTIKIQLGDYQIKEMLEKANKVGNISVVRKIYNGGDIKHIGKIAEKIVIEGKAIALIAIINDDRTNLIFTSSKDIKELSMSELLKDAISLIDGRGGGSQFSAQGGGKSSNNLDSTLDYAMMKIKKSLE